MLSQFKIFYTIFVFIALAAFEHIVIGLFPPLFQYIATDLNIHIASLGYISGINILVTALSSIYWGYIAGKYNRKRLIIIGTIIWVLSVFLTSISQNYFQLLFFQILTGLGLGCMASIGFSVLTDYIPFEKRGIILSFWGMAQGLGGIAGSVMASLTATSLGWRWSFEVVGGIGLFLIILYLFVKEPTRGQSEPELKEYMRNNEVYHYMIEPQQLKSLLLKGSNKYLYLQALFLNIATGSLIWIPTLFTHKLIAVGYSMDTAVVASGYLYALFQIGGMGSFYFGHLGDRLKRKNLRHRNYMTAFFVIATLPLYMILFTLPLKNLTLSNEHGALSILVSLIQQIFTNPWMSALFIVSFFASAVQSANTPNWLALLTDVNLPEHRGAVFSVANLFNSFGRTIGNVGVGMLLSMISVQENSPVSYIITLSILQFFLIPSAYYYLKMAKHNIVDIHNVKTILKERIEKSQG